MATSSEEVLLIVKKVRQKKQDGALYLMAERIAWAPEGKDRFTISHMYADIKCKSAILRSCKIFVGFLLEYPKKSTV